MHGGARVSSAPAACRAFVVAGEPLLREGLALIVGTAAVEVVGCVGSIDELTALARPFDVLVVHVVDGPEALALSDLCRRGMRIVGVHDTLAPTQVAAALAGGVSTMVDTSAAPAVLIGAVVGTQARTRLRWTRPAIGPMPLTPRERSVLALVAAGRTSSDVATALGISARTVEKHKQRIFERLGVQNQAHAVAIALHFGLLEPGPTAVGAGFRRLR